jgi:hypothetical protein
MEGKMALARQGLVCVDALVCRLLTADVAGGFLEFRVATFQSKVFQDDVRGLSAMAQLAMCFADSY